MARVGGDLREGDGTVTDAKTYEERIDVLREEFLDKVDALAAEVRRDLVVPTCKRYRLGFLSGNGDFWFHGTKRGKRVRYDDQLDADVPEPIRAVLEVLDLEVGYSHHLGYHVEPVDEPLPSAKRKVK